MGTSEQINNYKRIQPFVEIMDSTLRDGEQTSGVSFLPHEKLIIARMLLSDLNVDRIEVASARVSEGEREAVSMICRYAARIDKLERVEVLGFIDGGKSVDWAAECGCKTLNLLAKGSLKHCTHQLQKSPEEHIEDIVREVKYARSKGITVNLYLEDWSNGMKESPSYVYQLMDSLCDVGIRRFMLPDTLGINSVIPAPSGATVAADLMNVLYAGFQNPMSVSVPGVPQNAVSVSMAGGTLTSKGDGHYIAVPAAIGKDVTFTVSANDKGKVRQMGQVTFKVRKLPDPTPYVEIGTDRFKGGGLAKASLMGLNTLGAAIDEGLLDIPFKVLSFETVFFDNMGNAVPIASDGNQFSGRQKDAFRKLSRNRRFYIRGVKAIGPDGLTRNLPAAMEVIVK